MRLTFLAMILSELLVASEIVPAKIISAGSKTSSGVIFQFNGKSFAVGDDRTILENEVVVQAKTLGTVNAKVLTTEWGKGLALLSIDAKPQPSWLSLDDMSREPTNTSSDISIESYDGPISGGNILTTKSPRHFLPLIEYVIEIEGANLTAPQLGAPAKNSSDEFLGVVSPFYIRLNPGHPSKILEWHPDDPSVQVRISLTPAKEIAEWLSPLRSGKLPLEQFVIERGETLKVGAGAILFNELLPPPNQKPPETGDFPIGGGDAGGIGGAEDLESGAKLALSPLDKPIGLFPIEAFRSWHDSTINEISANGVAELPFLFHYDEASRDFDEYHTYRSAAEFFTLLKRNSGLEIAIIPAKVPSDDTTLRGLSRKSSRSAFLYFTQPPFIDEKVLYLIRQVYLYSKLMDSNQKAYVKTDRLNELSDREGSHKREWDLVIDWQDPRGKELHDAFTDLIQEWKKR